MGHHQTLPKWWKLPTIVSTALLESEFLLCDHKGGLSWQNANSCGVQVLVVMWKFQKHPKASGMVPMYSERENTSRSNHPHDPTTKKQGKKPSINITLIKPLVQYLSPVPSEQFTSFRWPSASAGSIETWYLSRLISAHFEISQNNSNRIMMFKLSHWDWEIKLS
jgi:hypothetical protein